MDVIQSGQCNCVTCNGGCMKSSRLWEDDDTPMEMRILLLARELAIVEQLHVAKMNIVKSNEARLREVIKSVLTELTKPIDCQDIDGIIASCKQALKIKKLI